MTRTEIQALRERAAQQMMSGMFTDLALGEPNARAAANSGSWTISVRADMVLEFCDLAEQALEDET